MPKWQKGQPDLKNLTLRKILKRNRWLFLTSRTFGSKFTN